MAAKKYDSTVARIAGNLLSGMALPGSVDPSGRGVQADRQRLAEVAVAMARAIVKQTERTEPPLQDTE